MSWWVLASAVDYLTAKNHNRGGVEVSNSGGLTVVVARIKSSVVAVHCRQREPLVVLSQKKFGQFLD